jgi:hypothetical protein
MRVPLYEAFHTGWRVDTADQRVEASMCGRVGIMTAGVQHTKALIEHSALQSRVRLGKSKVFRR